VAVCWVVWLEDEYQVEGLSEGAKFDLEGLGAQGLMLGSGLP
jgi:hypothetical protein